MSVKKFSQFINESASESINLYRLVAVGEGEDLVVDTKTPGKYYFKNESDINTDVLKKKGEEYHVIKVKTDSSNIDEELSRIESEKHGCECVVLKDESQVEYEGTEPFQK
jgi:uncharacterized protein (UPF0128 family)